MFGLSALSQMLAQDAAFSPPIGRNQQIPRPSFLLQNSKNHRIILMADNFPIPALCSTAAQEGPEANRRAEGTASNFDREQRVSWAALLPSA
jgi:hypothetical protein